ncbi:MAG: lytic transglycosylase domain-containing protein [Pseudomonadota bacterium]
MTPRIAARAVICAVLGVWVSTIPGLAQDPPPFPDFTFKREKVPQGAAGNRITIQIDPAEQAETLSRGIVRTDDALMDEEPAERDALVGSFAWFWSDVPYDLSADPSIRLKLAFARLDKEGVTGPRLQVMQQIASANGADILQATIGSKVSPALVLAVIAVESGGRVQAESHKGAQGLMQLMPDTAARFGVTDSLSSSQNIKGGVAYLDWLLAEFNDDAVLALAGYNAGEGAVRRHGGVPPYAETRDYVPKVLAAFEVARGLCQTQPQLITDACALRLASN